jgi:hypothetical protein
LLVVVLVFGVLLGRIVTSILGYIPNGYFSSMLIDYSAMEQLSDFLPAFLLSGIVRGLAYSSEEMLAWPGFTGLWVFGALATALCIACAYVFKMEALKWA